MVNVELTNLIYCKEKIIVVLTNRFVAQTIDKSACCTEKTIDKSGCTEDVRMGEENGIDSIYLRLRTLEEQVGSIITDKKYSLISV